MGMWFSWGGVLGRGRAEETVGQEGALALLGQLLVLRPFRATDLAVREHGCLYGAENV